MIKSLLRWGTTLTLVGVTVFGAGINKFKALALPPEQIVEKLNRVPVFTLMDEKGAFFVLSNEEVQVAQVFLSHEEAKQMVEQLKTKDPELGNKAKIVVSPLGAIYHAVVNQDEENPVNIDLIPSKASVDSAKVILDANGTTYENGVPLFFATVGEEKTNIVVEMNNEQVIPMFFERQQLDNMLQQVKKQKPEIADNVQVEIVPLETVISSLHSGEDQALSKILLVPSAESTEFVRQNIPPEVLEQQQNAPNQGDANQEAAPAPATESTPAP